MKTIMTRAFVVLLGMLFTMLTANCNNKKTAENSEIAETTAKVESVIKVSTPPFKNFVVVTTDDAGLYKKADTNSPTLTRWIESECESDFCENFYQWSDQPAKSGFELSTDIMASEGRVFPVLGEEGDFYKVSTLDEWCQIESAYIPKASVGNIECAPIKADMLESDDNYFKCRVMKDGKYKNIVFIDEYNELEGESLEVGVLNDGVVAIPTVYRIFGSPNDEQNEDIIIDDSEDDISLKYKKNLSMPTEDDYFQLDLTKLSDEQIAKIIDTVTKKKPEYVHCMYHFPAQGLQYFYYKTK